MFDDEASFYTEEELSKEEAKLKDKEIDIKVILSKDDSRKAVETKQSVINVANSSEKVVVTDLKTEVLPKNVNEIPKKEIAAPATDTKKPKKKVQKKPEDYEDMWYQDYDGNWFNEYDQDDIEWEDGDSDSAPATLSARPSTNSDNKQNKKNVSFDESQSGKLKNKSGRTARGRWLWAYNKIVQVGRDN